MSANTVPLFPLTPNIGFGKVLTANTATDGTGTTVVCYTAGANGSRVDSINVWSLGTSVASKLRLFLNNGGVSSTATNNALYWEVALASDTLSQTAVQNNYVIPAGFILPPNWTIIANVGTTQAAGNMVIVTGGDF